VADGNFKADHVRQKNESGDIWLSEGGGMIPKRHDYMAFLKSAIERHTVRYSIYYGLGPGAVLNMPVRGRFIHC
jgi:hypothetical protein